MAECLENDLDVFLTDHGLTFTGLFDFLVEKNSQVIQMSEADYREYCDLYDEVFKESSSKKDKGNKLEDLMVLLFVKAFPRVFEVQRNCRTSSNEIDLMINWSQQANLSGISKEFADLGNTFLCECKNYEGKVGVTYIGKFSSLLSCSDTKLGIMVAWDGVTGNGWNAGNGLIKKIALAEKRYILVINKEDLGRIYQKKTNLFELLSQKYRSLKQDISYEKLIKKHELADAWIK